MMNALHSPSGRVTIIALSLIFTCAAYPCQSSYADIKRSVKGDGTVDYSSSEKKAGRVRSGEPTVFKSRHIPLIERLADEYGVDAYLIECIVKVESNFNENAVSVAGAMGLMQIMQDIARAYGVGNPFDPEENLRAGIRHFKSLLQSCNNDPTLALAAYHAGLGRVKKRNAVPPIKSTVDYVKSVLSYYTNNDKSNVEIETKVKKLYKRIEEDGTINIYGK
jgi:soluble lytic murein transglycosylase-like protein